MFLFLLVLADILTFVSDSTLQRGPLTVSSYRINAWDVFSIPETGRQFTITSDLPALVYNSPGFQQRLNSNRLGQTKHATHGSKTAGQTVIALRDANGPSWKTMQSRLGKREVQSLQ